MIIIRKEYHVFNAFGVVIRTWEFTVTDRRNEWRLMNVLERIESGKARFSGEIDLGFGENGLGMVAIRRDKRDHSDMRPAFI